MRCTGLVGSAPAYLLAELWRQQPAPAWLVITPTTEQLSERVRELRFFLAAAEGETPPIHAFYPFDSLPYFRVSPHRDVQAGRIRTLAALLFDPRPKIVVASIAGLASPVLSPSILQDKRQILKKGNEIDREVLIDLLSEWGYQQSPLVEDRGSFAVRGGIVDLWGPLDDNPWRLELMGDEIESIRRFDPAGQKSLEFLDEVWLVPVRELLWDEKTRQGLAARFIQKADETGLKATEKREIADKIREGLLTNGIEHLLPLLDKQTHSLLDYLPTETRVILNDREPIQTHLADLQTELQEAFSKTDSFERCLVPTEILNDKILEEEKLCSAPQLELTEFSVTTEGSIQIQTEENNELRAHAMKKGESPFAAIASTLQKWLAENRVVLVASSSAQQRRLLDLLAPYEVPTQTVEAPFTAALQQTDHQLTLVVGDLSRGFRWPSEHLIVITDEEIFGPKVRRGHDTVSRRESFSAINKLKEGDPIVHEEHGVGLYRGLLHMEIEGITNDFVLLEYAKGDKLYLPIYRLNQIESYSGGDKAPKLDRLGGNTWQKTRAKAQKAIRQLAGELINLYAARTAGRGHAFSPGNELFESFEASFPYEETEDQERTISEVLADMEQDLPMDRLVLGDVGYGKTEVAMRAAFKAILDNKQVAILVPTTVLAFQHFQNLQERFKEYPVTIGMLSRFQSRAEIKTTLEQMRAGQVDIVIGTHRLLQPDVSFPDLGLLVIDEEHRFGVNQKEKIKQLKKSVDVLALSATPIPRSLNMALTGIRGISVIETPPTDRLAIRTFVAPYSEAIVNEAVLREVRRGGQIFYVHNRVQNIDKVQKRLSDQFPGLRIAVAHGQMPEAKLEEVMISFVQQEQDILLCTTIIESGIDIPTANTILIERADRMGLAQIYQLRGRVGRGAQRAYAYLMVPHSETLTTDAKKRLSVLQRFSELGSGFKMASYDLEIRGAGNVLGEKQWGHMEAIGYELYSELLEKAVRELKGEEVLSTIEPELHLKVAAFLPEDYIPDPQVRLDLYRRLASLPLVEDCYAIEEEIVDRFGSLPPETENLLHLMILKVLAKKLRIRALHCSDRQFVYHFDSSTQLQPTQILDKLKQQPQTYQLTPEMKLIVQQTATNDQERLSVPRYFLQGLAETL